MAENSQVSRKRTLFTLAGKITRYANHWLLHEDLFIIQCYSERLET